MVSRKREDPFTPEPNRVLHHAKKMKEYVSPMPKTPLRNVLTPDHNGTGSIVRSSRKPAAEQPFMPGSASRSRLASSFESLEDVNEAAGGERRAKREELAKKRKERKAALLSPAVGSSPRAAPPQTLSNSKQQRQTPVASVIAGEIAARPLPGSSGQPKMSAEQMNKVFEEWIKIAADNKINSKNTWNLALIDYFSELTFLKDGPNSINFQKASCTLDGCVKIYSSRVDSVVDETSKLLNGLAEGTTGKKWGEESNVASRAGSDNEDEDGELGGKRKAGQRKGRHVNTLEKTPEALVLKQFDLEYAVDPLFRKTCAEFDESSSRGQLLSGLALSPEGRVIFDSSAQPSSNGALTSGHARVSVGPLKAALGPALHLPLHCRLNATFAGYNFNETSTGNDLLSKALHRLEQFQVAAPVNEEIDRMELDGQVFDAPQIPMDEDDYGGAYGMDDDYGFDQPDGMEALDPIDQINETHLQAVTGFSQETNSGSGNMLSYFDESLKHTWAGPNHWKVRRPRQMTTQTASQRGTTPTSRKKEFVLEFNDETEVDIEALFSKPANPATISLSRAMIEDRNSRDNLLPEDMHFSSQNFLRLFTKPSWRFGTSTTSRTMVQRPAAAAEVDGEEKQVGQEFWTQMHPEGVAEAQLPDLELNQPEAMPFYDDDYGFDGPDMDHGDHEDDHGDLTQMSTVTNFGLDLVALKAGVQVQRLAFSRVAKRVDVHRLKDAIWSGISTTAQQKGKPDRFSELVGGLGKGNTYPKEALKDVSVPYCFICLLHLANEHGLTIQKDGNDLAITTQ